MNKMIFELQPDIIVNNRNKLDGDFSTPEQRIVAETNGRAWESCMTLNDSWGFQRADNNWKSSQTVIRNLITCSRDGGNYLLNIGPKPDGSIPPESVKILTEVGDWMKNGGQTIYGSDICQPRRANYAMFTRKGNTLYMHVHFWPGQYVAIGGLKNKVLNAKILKTGQPVQFTQNEFHVRFTNLPMDAPDHPLTTIAVECDGEPQQDNIEVGKTMPRDTRSQGCSLWLNFQSTMFPYPQSCVERRSCSGARCGCGLQALLQLDRHSTQRICIRLGIIILSLQPILSIDVRP
jgi:alpha-L-fucosidase